MFPLGHLSAGYLISQTPKVKGIHLPVKEVVTITACGLILDFDFFILPLFGYPGASHHNFPVHTPMGIVIMIVLLAILTQFKLSKLAYVLGFMALISHLVFDDLSYWLYRLGIGNPVPAQINWFYPANINHHPVFITTEQALYGYLIETPTLFILELLLFLFTVGYLIYQIKKGKNEKD